MENALKASQRVMQYAKVPALRGENVQAEKQSRTRGVTIG